MTGTQEILDLIDAFIENESSLAGYYGACIEKLPETREKWEALRREEESHADVFRQIRKSVEEFPFQWKMGSYQAKTIRLMCDSVKGKTEELKQGKLNRNYAINFIADIEQSLIESNIGKALTTDIVEFQRMLARVQENTIGHKQLLRSLVK